MKTESLLSFITIIAVSALFVALGSTLWDVSKARKVAVAVYENHLYVEYSKECGSPPGNPRSELLDPAWLKCVDDARSKAEEKVAAEIAAYRD